MRPLLAALLAWNAVRSADACSFCAADAERPTLREVVGRCGVVLVGTASGATIDADGSHPATQFAPVAAIKGEATPVTLRRYLPPSGPTPERLIVFAKAGKLADPELILVATPGLERLARELVASPPESRLAFAFARLDDADAAVRADSFAEFARASDAEVLAAKAAYDPAKLRKLLAGSNPDRAGVFAVLLGHCGRAEDAAHLDALAATAGPALGGTLAGLTLADPARGWRRIGEAAADANRSYSERFAAVTAARFVRRCRPGDHAEAARFALGLLSAPEFADAAAEDLREWSHWAATPEVVRVASLPTHRGRLTRRALVRFALASPDARARALVAEARSADPRLVADLEAASP